MSSRTRHENRNYTQRPSRLAHIDRIEWPLTMVWSTTSVCVATQLLWMLLCDSTAAFQLPTPARSSNMRWKISKIQNTDRHHRNIKDAHDGRQLALQSFLPTIADYAVGAGTFSIATGVLFSLSSLLAVDTFVIKKSRKSRKRALASGGDKGSMTVSSVSRDVTTTLTPETHSAPSRSAKDERDPTLSEEVNASDLAVEATVKAALISNAAAQLQDLDEKEKENTRADGKSLESDRENQWVDQHDELKSLQDELSGRSERARSNEKFQRDLLNARLSNEAKQARVDSTPSAPDESFHRALLAAQLANRHDNPKPKRISVDPSISKEEFQRSLLSAQLGYSRKSSGEHVSENPSSGNEGAHLINSKATDEREDTRGHDNDTDFQRSLLSARIANDRSSKQQDVAASVIDQGAVEEVLQGVAPSPSPLEYESRHEHEHDSCQDASERDDVVGIKAVDDSAAQSALDFVEKIGIQATKEKMLKKIAIEEEVVVMSEETDQTKRRVRLRPELGRRIRQKRTYVAITLAAVLGKRLIAAWLGA